MELQGLQDLAIEGQMNRARQTTPRTGKSGDVEKDADRRKTCERQEKTGEKHNHCPALKYAQLRAITSFLDVRRVQSLHCDTPAPVRCT